MSTFLIAKLVFSQLGIWELLSAQVDYHVSYWLSLIDKSNKRLDVWKGGNMSTVGWSGEPLFIGASLGFFFFAQNSC